MFFFKYCKCFGVFFFTLNLIHGLFLFFLLLLYIWRFINKNYTFIRLYFCFYEIGLVLITYKYHYFILI